MPIPIVIAGAGPVGTVLALELAHHGVPSVLIERSTAPSRHPKMDFLNARSMELLARLGLAPEIRAHGVPPEYDFTFRWYRSLAEPPVATWSYPSVDGVRAQIADADDGTSPAESYQRLTGSVLEGLLRRRVRREKLIELREGWVCAGVTADPGARGGADVHVTDSQGRSRTLNARYVVGCDGANSVVRESAGIGMRGAGPSADYVDVYFTSSDPVLRRYGRSFLAIVGSGVTLVSRDENNTWTAAFPAGEDLSRPSDPAAELIRLLGVEVGIDKVINVARWQGNLTVADRYRKGPVFLAGDAAHQFYPTGGHGANTGIADAIDLGWKLAARLTGWGGEKLLDSYGAERRPIALFNREMCLNLLEVWRRFQVLSAEGASNEQLAGFLAHDSYQVSNIGIHCGYRYSQSPVIWHEGGTPPPWEWQRIVPTTWPGGRPPSISLPGEGSIFASFGREFTLVDFTTEGIGAPVVADAKARGIPVSHLPLRDERTARAWEAPLVLVRPDQHVAWRGHDAPAEWGKVLERVTGAES